MYRRNKITRPPHQGSGDTGPGLYDGDCSEARTHSGLCIVYMQFVLDYAIASQTIHLNHHTRFLAAVRCLFDIEDAARTLQAEWIVIDVNWACSD